MRAGAAAPRVAHSVGVGAGFIIFFFAALIALGFLLHYFSKDASIRRELRKAKRFPIGQLPEGVRGRIVGRAYPLMEPLQAPLTGRPCVYFIATLEQRVQHGKTSSWRTVVTDSRAQVFGVRDESGRAIVDPSLARISLDFDNKSTSGTFDNPTPAEEAFLARHNQTGKSWVFNKYLRYREAIIGVDEPVAILGSGIREPDPDAPPAEAYRGDAPTRLRLTSSAAHPLVISDSHDTTLKS